MANRSGKLRKLAGTWPAGRTIADAFGCPEGSAEFRACSAVSVALEAGGRTPANIAGALRRIAEEFERLAGWPAGDPDRIETCRAAARLAERAWALADREER